MLVHAILPPACVRTRTLSGQRGLAGHQTKNWPRSHADIVSLVSLWSPGIESFAQARGQSTHFGAKHAIYLGETENEFMSVTQ